MGAKLQELDSFGQTYSTRIDEGRDKLQSKMGAFCRLFLLLTVLVYGGYKSKVLLGTESVDVRSVIVENHFNSSYVFGFSQGLNIAAAMVNPKDPNGNHELDPAYGKFVFRKFMWEAKSEGNYEIQTKEL